MTRFIAKPSNIWVEEGMRIAYRQMSPWSNLQTSIFKCAILEGIPKGQTARWIREADAAILVRDDATTDRGDFDDKLGLCDTWFDVAWIDTRRR